MLQLFLVTIFLACNYYETNCFNFDVTAPIFKQVTNPENAENYFGYSIAQHSTKNGDYILVGAPKDSYESLRDTGAVYKCPLNLDRGDDCEQIKVNFDSVVGDQSNKKNYDKIIKEQFIGTRLGGQWFGVSLSSTGNGQFSACAHKYAHYYNFTKRDEHMAYGACFTFSNDFVQEYKHVPCLIYTHETGLYHANNYAYCQAGTSMLMSQGPNLGDSYGDGTDTFISYGMPSALNFRGLVGLRNSHQSEFLYGNSTKLCRFNPINDSPGYRGQGYCDNLWDKYSYLGMSHAIINQYRNKKQENVIAAGAPRDNLDGVIRFFTNTYEPQFGGPITRQLKTALTGPPGKGAYFGFAIVACDVNGDNVEDLIVGAPYFNLNKYEPNAGAIYVYLNHETEGFSNSYVFNYTGKVRSLFGHSIACIGDIDTDGFLDFAVGAPYETDNPTTNEADHSSGEVYIFRGNSDPKKIKLTQKISAQNIPASLTGSSLKGFGYSLSGGRDMDSNKYPDLAVGALQSSAVLVLRTRPIVRIQTTIMNNASLQIIDQKKNECSYVTTNGNQRLASCFPIEFCIKLDSSDYNNEIMFSILAEPETRHSRVLFSSSNTNSFNSSMKINSSTRPECSSVQVVFKKDTYDFITPIKFLVRYEFVNQRSNVSRDSLSEINKWPIVHEDTSEFRFQAKFKTECGDRDCVTDLRLHASFVNLTVDENNVSILSFKESDTVSVLVRLENLGELAYATAINVEFDERLDFIRKDDLSRNSFSCAQNNQNKNNLACKMTTELGGVPFPGNHTTQFILTFSSSRLYRSANTSHNPDVAFKLNVLTLSTETNLANNQVDIFARFKVRANLFLYGKRTPEQLFFGDENTVVGESAIRSLEQIGPIIEHTYKINNGGPFSVQSFQLVVEWPHETRLRHLSHLKHGKHLLYLIERPTKIPNNHPINVICSGYEVNPLDLAAIKLRKKRSFQYDLAQKLTANEKMSGRMAVVDCFGGNAFCQKIVCNFYGDLNKDETISLKFTARVWNATLVEDYKDYEKVLIKSHGKLFLGPDVHDDNQEDNEHSVVTLAYSNVVVQSKKVLPVWVYVSSVLIGLGLLLLSTIAFWMVGFFERKKFGDEQYIEENEKLNKTPY